MLHELFHQLQPSKETTPTPSEETRPSHEAESSDSKVLSDEYMGCEEVFYWSCLCRYLHTKGKEGEEGLEKLLPTLSEFCDYIQRYKQWTLTDSGSFTLYAPLFWCDGPKLLGIVEVVPRPSSSPPSWAEQEEGMWTRLA